jgi:hypothetical protein
MKTSVTLKNGTLLEVGKPITSKNWAKGEYVTIIALGDELFLASHQNSNIKENSYILHSNDWLPYTAPQEEVKWKTFLMVVQHHKSHIPYQVIIRCKSIEEAKIIHKNAISITEVEIDIKEK